MENTENESIAQWKSGDSRAFGVLYDRYAERIYRFHYYRTAHRETAEDLTSQTFVKVVERIASFTPEKASFSTWIFTIARNTLIDHIRTRKYTVPIDEDLREALSGEKESMRRVDALKARDTLSQLSESDRELVILRLWDGLSFAEAARVLKKTEAACKMGFSRAMKQLRSLLVSILCALALMYS